jgi:DNA-binding HxlR family transcriptional regulator
VISVEEQAGCPVREVLDRVGDKWSVLAVFLLSERPMRFSELRRSIEGISQRMLTLTLRRLERDGLISRAVEPVTPPRVTYALTELGGTLITPIDGLMLWAQDHRGQVQQARTAYDLVHQRDAAVQVPV